MGRGARVVNRGQASLEAVEGVTRIMQAYGFPPGHPDWAAMFDHAGHVIAKGGSSVEAVRYVERVLANTYGPPAGEGPPLEGPDGTLGL